MKQWLLDDSLKDLSANNHVEEPKNIPHVISPLIVAKNFTGDKKLTFDLLYVNKHMKT